MNIQNLKGHIPDNVIAMIPELVDKFHMNTPLRLAHFLAQAADESEDFTHLTENLNYKAETLRKLFPKHVTTDAQAKAIEHNQEKIGNVIYSNRMGNGNEASGDGYKFRGRGYIQLTGKDNYKAFSHEIGEDCVANPDLVATKYPLASAGWFFNNKNINAISDKGATKEVVEAVTREVNGGEIGLDVRLAHFNKYFTLLQEMIA